MRTWRKSTFPTTIFSRYPPSACEKIKSWGSMQRGLVEIAEKQWKNALEAYYEPYLSRTSAFNIFSLINAAYLSESSSPCSRIFAIHLA